MSARQDIFYTFFYEILKVPVESPRNRITCSHFYLKFFRLILNFTDVEFQTTLESTAESSQLPPS